MGRMKRTKEGDNKGRETIARRRESDVRVSGQMRKIIGGNLGEKGKDRMYEERGAGMWKKGKETNGKGNKGRDERDTRTWGQGQTRGRRKGRRGVERRRRAEAGPTATATPSMGGPPGTTPTTTGMPGTSPWTARLQILWHLSSRLTGPQYSCRPFLDPELLIQRF